MANSVRTFVIESLKGFYERLPLKHVAVDGSVLTPDASGIVNINAVSQEEFTSAALATAAALNDLNDKIEDSTLYVKYPEFEDAAMTTAAALNVLNARTQDISSYVTRNELEEVELATAAALNDLNNKVGDTSAFATKVELEEVELGTSMALNDLDMRITNIIDDSIANIDASIGDIYTYIDDVESGLSDRISGLDSSIIRIDTSLSDISTKIGDISTRIRDVSTRVRDVSTRLNDVSTRVSDISTKVNDISTRIDDNEFVTATALADLDSRITDVSNRIIGGSSPWEHGEGENSAQLIGTTGATGKGAVMHAFGSDEDVIENPDWYIYRADETNYGSEAWYYADNYNGDGFYNEHWDTIIYNGNRYNVIHKNYDQFATDVSLGLGTGDVSVRVSIVLPPPGKSEASGAYSHAEGKVTNAKGNYSHAEGSGEIIYTEPPAYLYNVEENSWIFYGIDPAEYNCCLIFDNNPNSTSILFENRAMTLYNQYYDGYQVSLNVYDSETLIPDNLICDIFANGNVQEYTYDDGEGGYYHGLLFYNDDIISDIPDYINVYSDILSGGAIGEYSHAEGSFTAAEATGSHTEGAFTTTASGADYAHAEGEFTTASGYCSHTEGTHTSTDGYFSHAEGENTKANGTASHTEGFGTIAVGNRSHAEGRDTKTDMAYSHAEGYATLAYAPHSHAEGYGTYAYGTGSHAEGCGSYSNGYYTYGMELYRVSSNWNSKYRIAPDASRSGSNSASMNFIIENNSLVLVSFTEGNESRSRYCWVRNLDASGYFDLYYHYLNDDHYGLYTYHDDRLSLSIPAYDPTTYVETPARIGEVDRIVSYGQYSSARGHNTVSSGDISHTEGEYTDARKYGSHAEGYNTVADASFSHAEGFDTITSGVYSHAEGFNNAALGPYSHAEGGDSSTVSDITYAFIALKDTVDSSYIPEGCYGYMVYNSANYSTLQIGNYLYDNMGSYIRIINKGSYYKSSYTYYYIITDKPVNLADSRVGAISGYTLAYYKIPVLNNLAMGISSHAEGRQTVAYGTLSHSGGNNALAYGEGSYAAGDRYTIRTLAASFEGNAGATSYNLISNSSNVETKAYVGMVVYYKGTFAKITQITDSVIVFDKTLDASYPVTGNDKVMVYGNCAYGKYSSATGIDTIAYGDYSVAEGNGTVASGNYSHAEGSYSIASGINSHAEGHFAKATGELSYAKGVNTLASAYGSHASGQCSQATGTDAEATGYGTLAQGNYSHAEGQFTTASGVASHSEGYWTKASGSDSHAEGAFTTAFGITSHAEGGMLYNSISVRSFTRDGSDTSLYSITYNSYSGSVTDITGIIYPGYTIVYSQNTATYGVEGRHLVYNTAKVVEVPNKYYIRLDKDLNPGGRFSETRIDYIPYDITAAGAKGVGSHVEGIGTVALNDAEHTQGKFNVSHKDTSVFGSADNTIHSIGIGTGDSSRANAVEVMQNGDVYITGIGSYDGSNYLNASTLQEVVNAGGSGGGSTDIMTNITYAALKNLRDTSALTPGMQYRITDYECTTTQSNTSTAGHIFDIIVTADSSSALNENARATCHDGDTYFQNSNLDAWKLRYTLDNNKHLYEWAYNIATSITDTSNNVWNKNTNTPSLSWGKETIPDTGVKGLVYLFGNTSSSGGITTFYGCTSPNPQSGDYIYQFKCLSDTFPNNINQYNTNTKVAIYGTVDSGVYEEGKGIIYWMKDEFNNEASYDFKNILYKYNWTSYEWDETTETEVPVSHTDYVYTFNFYDASGNFTDYSIMDTGRDTYPTYAYVPAYCHDNVIKGRIMSYNSRYRDDFYSTLPNNILWSDSGYYNHTYNVFIGENSFNNFITGYNHTIEKDCHDITIGKDFDGATQYDVVSDVLVHQNCNALTIDGGGNNLTFMSGCAGLTLHTGGGDWYRIVNCVIYPTNHHRSDVRSDVYSVNSWDASDPYAVGSIMYENAYLVNGYAYSFEKIKKIEYSDLVNLKECKALAPGQQYYIYDYTTTVGDASLSSAQHSFGVIVTADTSASLNENAKICRSTDNYYDTCNLDAYEIKYSLDNDSSRFGWADPNGYGVIYYMKDENRNEACYDFTNILFNNKYTFDNNGADARLNASANIHDNVIGPHYGGYVTSGSQDAYYTISPNNIVMEGLMNYDNTFGPECYDLKFANQTIGNKFDGFVWDCSFGTQTIYNEFGSYITGSVFPTKLATSKIGSNCWYINLSGTTSYIRCNVLSGVKGTSTSSRLSVSITETHQYAGLNSSGVLKKWVPADLID